MIVERNGLLYVVIKYKALSGQMKKKWIAAGRSTREAKKIERQYLNRRDTGESFITRGDIPTVQEYLTEWLETAIKPPAKSLGTYENYTFCVNKIMPLIGAVKIDKLSPIQLTKAYKQLTLDGLSATSVRMVHRTLSSAFNKGVKWEICKKNPCAAADPPTQTPSPSLALTRDQAMALLKQSEKSGSYANAIIALGMLCGLRDAESCGLRWQDYDKDKGQLLINHNLSERYAQGIKLKAYEYTRPTKSGKKYLVLDKTKTESSNNFIMIPAYVKKVLDKLRIQYDRKKLALGSAFHDDQFILCDDFGIPLSPHKIYYIVQHVAQSYNEAHPDTPLPKMRAHDLRHTAATLLLEENIDIKYVSRQLRHSNTVITQNLYQHVTESMTNKTANAMDEIFMQNNERKAK